MKRFCAVAIPAVSLLFAANLALAQTPPATAAEPAGEVSPVQHAPASTGPIVLNWKLKKLDGTMNLTINKDGSWVFSGHVKDKKPDKDMDMSVALKSKTGAVILFTNIGNMADGVEWSKQGQSDILRDDFATFADKHEWTWAYHLPLNSEGKAKRFEEQEKKKAEIKKEEEEAKKKHDEKVAAEKKKELEKQEQEEQAAAEQAAAAQQAQQSSGGGGSSIGSVLSTIGAVAGGILACF